MNRYADILLALLLAVFTVQAQAGIVIGGTRVIYNGDKKRPPLLYGTPTDPASGSCRAG
jgi:P pilus assembly chaperone PapD